MTNRAIEARVVRLEAHTRHVRTEARQDLVAKIEAVYRRCIGHFGDHDAVVRMIGGMHPTAADTLARMKTNGELPA